MKKQLLLASVVGIVLSITFLYVLGVENNDSMGFFIGIYCGAIAFLVGLIGIFNKHKRIQKILFILVILGIIFSIFYKKIFFLTVMSPIGLVILGSPLGILIYLGIVFYFYVIVRTGINIFTDKDK